MGINIGLQWVVFELFINILLSFSILVISLLKHKNPLLWIILILIGYFSFFPFEIIFNRVFSFLILALVKIGIISINNLSANAMNFMPTIVYQVILLMILIISKNKKKDLHGKHNIICSNCGRVLKEDMKYCPYCGNNQLQ